MLLRMQEASVTMYVRQAWNDPRLAFRNIASEREFIRIYAWDDIWVPDTFFRNDLGSFIHEQTVPNRFMRLKNNGDVWYVIK